MSKPIIFIENKYYSPSELYLYFTDEDIVSLIKKGIIEFINNGYKFNFVGVVSIRNIAFIIIPKILKDDNEQYSNLTIKTLRKYSGSNIQLFDGTDYFNTNPDHPDCSELSISEFLLNDFRENGLYKHEEELYQINGDGDINWVLTVNSIFPLYNKNQPLYIDTLNQITLDDKNNLTLAIHKWSLGYSIKKYSHLLDYDFNYLTFDNEENLNDIGEIDYLIKHLQGQLSLIFSDREIRLIKSLIYLLKKKADNEENDLSLYGTKKYENIWEAICKIVVKDNYKGGKFFSSPTWNILNQSFKTNSTLIPDITSENPQNDNFYLFDAKYYSLKFKDGITGEPGYKDILKQFLYQIHIEKKIERPISNAFLFPLDDQDFQVLKQDENNTFVNDSMAVIGFIEHELFPNKKIWVIICPLIQWKQRFISNNPINYTDLYWHQ